MEVGKKKNFPEYIQLTNPNLLNIFTKKSGLKCNSCYLLLFVFEIFGKFCWFVFNVFGQFFFFLKNGSNFIIIVGFLFWYEGNWNSERRWSSPHTFNWWLSSLLFVAKKVKIKGVFVNKSLDYLGAKLRKLKFSNGQLQATIRKSDLTKIVLL